MYMISICIPFYKINIPYKSQTETHIKCICNTIIPKNKHQITKHRWICSYSFVCCRECYSIFQDRSSLIHHQNLFNHKKEGLFTHKIIKKRVKCSIKPSKLYFCSFFRCNKIFTNFGIFNKHKKTHIKQYKCSYNYKGCNKYFSSKT
eukprot:321241_1